MREDNRLQGIYESFTSMNTSPDISTARCIDLRLTTEKADVIERQTCLCDESDVFISTRRIAVLFLRKNIWLLSTCIERLRLRENAQIKCRY